MQHPQHMGLHQQGYPFSPPFSPFQAGMMQHHQHQMNVAVGMQGQGHSPHTMGNMPFMHPHAHAHAHAHRFGPGPLPAGAYDNNAMHRQTQDRRHMNTREKGKPAKKGTAPAWLRGGKESKVFTIPLTSRAAEQCKGLYHTHNHSPAEYLEREFGDQPVWGAGADGTTTFIPRAARQPEVRTQMATPGLRGVPTTYVLDVDQLVAEAHRTQ